MNTNSVKSPFVTVKEVAEHFNVTPSAVYKWCHKGLLPAGKLFGTMIRIKRTDLEEFAAKRKR